MWRGFIKLASIPWINLPWKWKALVKQPDLELQSNYEIEISLFLQLGRFNKFSTSTISGKSPHISPQLRPQNVCKGSGAYVTFLSVKLLKWRKLTAMMLRYQTTQQLTWNRTVFIVCLCFSTQQANKKKCMKNLEYGAIKAEL